MVLEATHFELINSIPKSFPDPAHPKYWFQPLEGPVQFRIDEYWEAVGVWWFALHNVENEEVKS